MEWYNSLIKPTWTPEPATIGLIWQILYPIIFVTFAFVLVQLIRRKVPWADILVVWGTILWIMIAIWKHYRWVAIAQIPYFIWVSVATLLQLSISWSNWQP
jgi:tryptophan-rich sensory protein